MLLFSILTAAIAPGVALLTYLYLKDRYDSEPIHLVLKLFLTGMLIVVPIMVIQRGIELFLGSHPLLFSFGLSGGVEEVVKWFVLYHIIYNHTEFDEPYDGIVYAASISLGFATIENILYAVYFPSTFTTLMLRALLPVSGHALFGIMMGYYFGKAKFAPRRSARRLLAVSLLLPVGLHGLYDWIITSEISEIAWGIVPFMAFLWIWGLVKIGRANARSPFRIVGREEGVKL
ncbi:intramembrane metalloprotease PrsW [Paenibacillus albicereus]|uniref:Protease PrsW n=1 Tax=Paenibacillus albicereus TaxID=2726185 RepID=A0A6H2GWP8_9BACL|nr:glutamic-type intramembrane protease PrsW [Paenibacillus albicereus]QJC51840.1 intramembrane metalloprotease PrsW [Paenibacillus albicereus]